MKEKITLKNKLTVIHDCNPNLHSVKITVFFKCGSLFESLGNQGITHLTEHMFFRRLFDLRQNELYFKTELIGGFLRGRTFCDCVCFDIGCFPKYFKRAFDIISRTLYNFHWEESELEAEKAIVKNQIDFKGFSIESFCDKKYFKSTKYAFPIMGTFKSLENLTIEKVNRWKEKYFTCDNCCIVLTGAFSKSDLNYALISLEKIENRGESFSPPKILPQNIFNRTNNDDKIIADDSGVSDVFVYFDIDIEKYNINQCEIIMNMLCKGDGSRLIYLLRDKLGLAENIDSWLTLYNGFARMSFTYSVRTEYVKESLKAMFCEISNFRKIINIRDFQSTITFFTDNVYSQFDDASELGFNYGWYDFIMGVEYNPEEKAKYNKKLSIESLTKTANNILSSENMTVMILNDSKINRKRDLQNLLLDIRAEM